MIALYFTVFPDAYDEYQSEVEEYKTEEKEKEKNIKKILENMFILFLNKN